MPPTAGRWPSRAKSPRCGPSRSRAAILQLDEPLRCENRPGDPAIRGERDAELSGILPGRQSSCGGHHQHRSGRHYTLGCRIRPFTSIDGEFFRRNGVAGFSPDGKVLISCISWTQDETPRRRQQCVAAGLPPLPEESSIQLWDVASGNEIRRIGMGKSRIKQAALAPNGESIATARPTKQSDFGT